MARVCETCSGTGNARHGGIANDGAEDSGCLGCGGCGYTSWQNNVFRIVFLISFGSFMVWLLSHGG